MDVSVANPPKAVSEAGSLAPLWRMSELNKRHAPAREYLPHEPGPLWALVESGSAFVETAAGIELLNTGDAVLIDARTAHRLRAVEDAVVFYGDLSPTVPTLPIPSPFVVAGFSDRHAGIAALVTTCPLARECNPEEFAESYAGLIGAAMAISWRESTDAVDRGDGVVDVVVNALRARPAEPWTVEQMARLVHLSRSALTERIRRTTGHSPMRILRDVRMEQARRLLSDHTHPVLHVAFAVGYGSVAAFSRAFTAHHGVGPQAWRAGQGRWTRSEPKPMPAAIAALTPTT